MVPREQGQCFTESFLGVAIFGPDETICSLLKDWNNLVLDLLQLLEGVSEGCFDDVVRLWHSDLLKHYASLLLNHLNKHLLL